MDFEWDATKDASNRRKHGVSFIEAATLFGDPLAASVADPDHSADEARFMAVGHIANGRVLVISYTEREGRVRIISAREATPGERRAYERRTR